jgi:HEAT repeat protein
VADLTDKSGAEVLRLRTALATGDRHDRAMAAIALGQHGVSPHGLREARLELEKLLEEEDDLVAVAALYALWKLGGEGLAFDRLARGLASPDEETVQASVEASSRMGAAVVPELVALVDAGSPHSVQILRALGDIGGPRACAALERFRHSTDADLAAAAAAALED